MKTIFSVIFIIIFFALLADANGQDAKIFEFKWSDTLKTLETVPVEDAKPENPAYPDEGSLRLKDRLSPGAAALVKEYQDLDLDADDRSELAEKIARELAGSLNVVISDDLQYDIVYQTLVAYTREHTPVIRLRVTPVFLDEVYLQDMMHLVKEARGLWPSFYAKSRIDIYVPGIMAKDISLINGVFYRSHKVGLRDTVVSHRGRELNIPLPYVIVEERY